MPFYVGLKQAIEKVGTSKPKVPFYVGLKPAFGKVGTSWSKDGLTSKQPSVHSPVTRYPLHSRQQEPTRSFHPGIVFELILVK